MNTSEFQFHINSNSYQFCFSRTIHQNPQNTTKFLDSEAKAVSLPTLSTILRSHHLHTHIVSGEKAIKQNMKKCFIITHLFTWVQKWSIVFLYVSF